MTAVATTATEQITVLDYWMKSKDKYGRPMAQLDRIHVRDSDGRWVHHERNLAVVVTLPRHYFEEYGHRYLVNVRRNPSESNPEGRGDVTYWVKRADALRVASSTAGR